MVLGLGALVVAALGFWLWVYGPVREHLDVLDRRVQARQAEFREVQELARRYLTLSASAHGLEERLRRGRGFSILSYLEKVALEQNLRKKVSQMRARGGQSTPHYRENAIEIKMEGVRLPELVRFLYAVEHPRREDNAPDLLRIRELRIRKATDSREFLDVTFQVSGYELLETT